MNYEIAEYRYTNHIREHYGLIGEIEYPSRTHSRQDTEGNWLLISEQGLKMGKVFKNGDIIA